MQTGKKGKMNKRYDLDRSYGLEEKLSRSIERFKDNAEKTRMLMKYIGVWTWDDIY